jgi:Ser/Thr protein kinase RdoA (MazF antagonist)
LARNLGGSLAQLGQALRDFEHEGQNQILLWDLQRAADLRPLLPQVSDQQIHDRIERCLDDVEQNALPVFSSLRHQVIHADLNPGNVLVSEDDASSVAGVIDFGDMVHAPLVADVAIGAAYMRVQDGDPLALISPFITGYCAVTKLDDAEIELLYDLIRTRLITMIALRYWRIAARDADDAYSRSLLQGEGNAEQFLQAIDAVPREHFNAQIRQAYRS